MVAFGINPHAGIAVDVYSSRSSTHEGRTAMFAWFERHGFEPGPRYLGFPGSKPPAGMYIDDRGYLFTGANFPAPAEILAFVPWTKK